MRILAQSFLMFVASGVLLSATTAYAADKKQCLDASSRGQQLRDEGKLIDAREQLLVCSDAACPAPVPTYCAEWLLEVKRRIPTVVFRVSDPSGKDVIDVTVRLDGRPVKIDGSPIEVDPGTRVLSAERPGSRPYKQTVVVAQGEKERLVAIRLEADGSTPPTATSTSRPVEPEPTSQRPIPIGSFIGWGVGAAGLVGFGIFGLKAKLDYDDYESTCGNRCAPDARDEVKTSMVLADVFLVVGIVGAAAGTVLYLMNDPKPSTRSGSLR